MNKKQALSIGVVFTLLVTAKFIDFDRKQGHYSTKVEEGTPLASAQQNRTNPLANSPYFTSLHFANEYLPLGDVQIEEKMMSFLEDYSYQRVRSYHIHDKAIQSLPKVAEILESYGIPQDFKYIPLIESGFSKNTTSHKGASGYWQFMPATAVAFGLTVNEEVDERQDLVKSTHAAAKYILSLYDEFENWTLVAAAYNVGGGSLRNTMQRQEEDNSFKLKLNKETAAYVYRLISMKEIIEHPDQHGYVNERALVASLLPRGEQRDGMPGIPGI